MAKIPTAQRSVSLGGLAEAFDKAQAERQALRAIVSALLTVHRMDPRNGEERLATIREMAKAALPLPDDKMDWAQGDHDMLTCFTEIFDSIEFAAQAMNNPRTKN